MKCVIRKYVSSTQFKETLRKRKKFSKKVLSDKLLKEDQLVLSSRHLFRKLSISSHYLSRKQKKRKIVDILLQNQAIESAIQLKLLKVIEKKMKEKNLTNPQIVDKHNQKQTLIQIQFHDKLKQWIHKVKYKR
jgi:transcription elongation factor